MTIIDIPCDKCGVVMQRRESSIRFKKSLGYHKFYHRECIPRDSRRGRSW